MAKTILVPLPNGVPPASVVRCIEGAAEPSDRVVFLARYPVDGYRWCGDMGGHGVLKGRQLADYYRWEENVRRAEHKAGPAIELLRAAGISASVQVCGAGLGGVVAHNHRYESASVLGLRWNTAGWMRTQARRWLEGLGRIMNWRCFTTSARSRGCGGKIETA